jgi:DNA-binding SARP family transcriptional activator
MTRHIPEHTAARRASTVRRGLAALVALALLVIGPPAALLTFVGNPVPKYATIGGRLTDEAVIGLLAAVVWLAWAQLMLAILVEAAAAIRGAPLPRRIPLSGVQQDLARRLVLAVAFLLAGSAAMSAASAAAGPAVAAVAPSVPGPAIPNLTPTQIAAPVARPFAESGPTRDQPEADRAKDRVGKPGQWYVVKPPHGSNHDTLWDIAERHLGDGLRWKEIYALNEGRTQPDGGELTIPRLIYPGWRLLLPHDATGLPEDAPRRPATPAPSSVRGDTTTARDAQPPPPVVNSGRTDASALAAPDVSGSSVTSESPEVPSALDEPADFADDSADETTDDDAGVPLGALTLGLGALACAGLTAELARRRRRVQRFRKPGERLRRPGPALERVENQLHAANAEITVNTLRLAFQQLAATCHRSGRPLPNLQTVQINPSGATLQLGSDEPAAMPPFTAAGPRTWRLDSAERPGTSGQAAEASEPEDDPVDPYPALLAVGVIEESILLINLEAAGTLRVLGPPAESVEILHALAAELGTSTLTASIDLALSGCPGALTRIIDRGRARTLDPDAGRRWAAAHVRDIARILGDAGIAELADARSRRVLSDLWAPAVLVEGSPGADSCPPPPAATEPGAGLCIVTRMEPDHDEFRGWTLTSAGDRWRLEPAGIELQPQRLDLTGLHQCEELLTVPVEPAPTVYLAPPEVPGPTPRIPAPVNGATRERVHVTIASITAQATPSPTDLAVLAEVIPDAPRPSQPGEAELASDVIAPRVLVLGPVEIQGVTDDVPRDRRRRTTELIAYLALHPHASHHQLDEALWPGARVSRNTRNPLVSRARRWLGDAPDGRSYVGKFSDGELYTLHPAITCDWHDFCTLSKRGLAAGPDGLDDLHAALDLVRGRPFLGVDPAAYGWAEADTQQMISAIVDVAEALAAAASQVGDYRRVRWATARGLDAEPFAERLHTLAAEAAAATGDHDEADRIIERFRRRIQELDPDDDIDPEVTLGRVVGG